MFHKICSCGIILFPELINIWPRGQKNTNTHQQIHIYNHISRYGWSVGHNRLLTQPGDIWSCVCFHSPCTKYEPSFNQTPHRTREWPTVLQSTRYSHTQLWGSNLTRTNPTEHHHGNRPQTVWWFQPSQQNHFDYACTVWYSVVKLQSRSSESNPNKEKLYQGRKLGKAEEQQGMNPSSSSPRPVHENHKQSWEQGKTGPKSNTCENLFDLLLRIQTQEPDR